MFKQSGVIPYRILDGKVEILLITSSRHHHWIVPKGWIAPLMSSAASAAKEAQEEAGVLGCVLKPAIGTYRDRKWGIPYPVELFLMQVETILDDWAEASIRRRKWYGISQAIAQVKKAELKQILEMVRESSLCKSF